MTQWYYSDYQRNRHGPVSAEDLAMLHANNQLQSDTLVWREGMAEWKPWREIMAEVISTPEVIAAAADPFAAPAPATSDSAYRPYAVAEPIERPLPVAQNADNASPYAPPQARVFGNANVVRGGKVVHAGFLKRFAAATIDNFIVTILMYIVLIPLSMALGFGMAGFGGSDPLGAGVGIAFIATVIVLAILMPALYFGWMQSSANQATLGKMAVGIKVTRSDGSAASFWRNFGRYALFIVLGAVTLALAHLVSAFTSGLSARKQALHDMVCDTLVVDKYAFTDHPEWQSEQLGAVTIVVLVLVGLVIALYVVGVLVMFAIGVGAPS